MKITMLKIAFLRIFIGGVATIFIAGVVQILHCLRSCWRWAPFAQRPRASTSHLTTENCPSPRRVSVQASASGYPQILKGVDTKLGEHSVFCEEKLHNFLMLEGIEKRSAHRNERPASFVFYFGPQYREEFSKNRSESPGYIWETSQSQHVYIAASKDALTSYKRLPLLRDRFWRPYWKRWL